MTGAAAGPHGPIAGLHRFTATRRGHTASARVAQILRPGPGLC
jgi:hypothetical protein